MHQLRPAIFLIEMTQSGCVFLEEDEKTGEGYFGLGYAYIKLRLFRLMLFILSSDEPALCLGLFCPFYAVLLATSYFVNFLWLI